MTTHYVTAFHQIYGGMSTNDAEHFDDKISNQPVNASANMYNIFALVTRRSSHHYNRTDVDIPSARRERYHIARRAPFVHRLDGRPYHSGCETREEKWFLVFGPG